MISKRYSLVEDHAECTVTYKSLSLNVGFHEVHFEVLDHTLLPRRQPSHEGHTLLLTVLSS